MKENQTIRGVVFDLDGTLIDSLEEIATAANKSLAGAGYPEHPTAAYRDFIGHGARVLLERALPETFAIDPETVEKVLDGFLQVYEETSGTISTLYPGIDTLLDALTEKGISLFILSNKPHAFAQRCAQHLLSRWSFDLILGEREEIPRKPDPAGAMEILNTSGIRSEECLYLGDTAVDMQTAKAAGMTSVGVLWGFRGKAELRAAGATHIIEHPMDLMDLL